MPPDGVPHLRFLGANREFAPSVRDLGYRPAGSLAAAVVAAEFTAVVLLAVFPLAGFLVSAAPDRRLHP